MSGGTIDGSSTARGDSSWEVVERLLLGVYGAEAESGPMQCEVLVGYVSARRVYSRVHTRRLCRAQTEQNRSVNLNYETKFTKLKHVDTHAHMLST